MHPLSETISQLVDTLADVNRVVVAFSGGIDSTVLLHAALHAKLSQPLAAIHVNHQLSKNASSWQTHCEQVFKNMEVSGRCFKVDISIDGGGIEQAARQARYKVFEQQLADGDLLLMGHHAEDQVETFFLRLARGAGLMGLGGIPKQRSFGRTAVARPFLSVSKAHIESYAKEHQLRWIEDESNESSDFDRNYLRLDVLPLLRARWPYFTERVIKTVSLLQDERSLLDDYVANDLASLLPRAERVGHSIDLADLREWRKPRLFAVIRQWLIHLGFRLPSQARLAEISNLLNADADRVPLLTLGDCELRRFRGRLYCLPSSWIASSIHFSDADSGLKAGPDYLVVNRSEFSSISRCHPYGREHSQTFKKLLQEFQLEPWLREHVPIVISEGRLAAVADLWVEADFYSDKAPAKQVIWPSS